MIVLRRSSGEAERSIDVPAVDVLPCDQHPCSLYSPVSAHFIGNLAGDETTPATTSVEFSLSKIPENQGSVASTISGAPTCVSSRQAIESRVDYRFIVHGHNNYLDNACSHLGFLAGSVVPGCSFIGPDDQLYQSAGKFLGKPQNPVRHVFMIIVFCSAAFSFSRRFLLRTQRFALD